MSNISIGSINVIVLVEKKRGYGRVRKRQHSDDLKNEGTTYRLSANQRLASKKLEQPIRNKNNNS